MSMKTQAGKAGGRRFGQTLLRGLVVAGLALPSAAAFVAAGGTAASAKDLTVDFANILESGELFRQLSDGLADAAKTSGLKLNRYNNNLDGPTTLNNARLMVQDYPDVILEYTGVEGIGASLKKLFNDAKIPFIAVNIPVPGGYWFNLVNRDIGADTAKVVVPLAKAKGWTAADTTVILVQSSQAGTEVNDCIRYFYVTTADAMGLDKVEPSAITALTTAIGKTGYQVDGKGTLEVSYTGVKNVLQTLPPDRHIILYSINDDSVLGAWRAVTEAKRQDNTIVAGLGGSVAALKELRTNPHWVAEGSIFMTNWGQYLTAMAVAVANGVTPPKLTKSPQAVLTKDSVDKY